MSVSSKSKNIEGFEALVKRAAPRWSVARLNYIMRDVLSIAPLKNADILEIGAGKGLLTCWLALNGARKVVALEPELAGSRLGMNVEACELRNVLGIEDRVEWRVAALNAFLRDKEHYRDAFDHAILYNVVNHLDENGVMLLHRQRSGEAWRGYVEIFKDLGSIVKPGGVIVVADCGRRNFWGAIGLRSPFAPTIEWEKHQQPGVWAELLSQAGFDIVKTRWSSPWQLRFMGVILGNAVGAYFTSSHFTIIARNGVCKSANQLGHPRANG